MNRAYKRIINKTTRSQYFNVKDPVPQKYKSDLAYKWTYSHIKCNESHIGETERRFEEHKHDKKSRIYKHSSENSHPHVWLDNFEIVGWKKTGDTLLINEFKPLLNKQDKSFPLKLFNWY